jgi:hypothetical protein
MGEGAMQMTQATNEKATPREVRAFLLEQAELPEGVTVGARGRLSAAAKEYFVTQTGREIVVAE